MRYLGFIAAMSFATSSCEEREAAQSKATPEVEHKSISHQFHGEWVFVGLAHPWHQGDKFGWAGYVTIHGDDIEATFVRSPQRARTGVNGPGPFLIPEEDQHRAAVKYEGKLVPTTGDGDELLGWTIHGTCFDQQLLWDQYSEEPDAIYIGTFDPPLMFKRLGAHPIYAPDEEPHASDGEPGADVDSPISDPFAQE